MGQRILLIGRSGQIGWELERCLAGLGEIVAPARTELDLADTATLRAAVRAIAPTLIVNAGAYTAVERAEDEPDRCRAINALAPGLLAEEARSLGAVIVHYSTDYVFDGRRARPYDEDDVPNPSNVYGLTKLEGEAAVRASGAAHLVLRTSWVYGARGQNFLFRFLDQVRAGRPTRVVADQRGAPNWCRFLAEATAQILSICGAGAAPLAEVVAARQGLYHLSAAGETSWHGFACAILEHVVANPAGWLPEGARPMPPEAVASTEYPSGVERPAYSVLSSRKLEATFGLEMPAWDRLLRLCLRPC